MRILVDENIPRMTVDALRGLGNDVKDIRGTIAQGLDRPHHRVVYLVAVRLAAYNKQVAPFGFLKP